MSKEGDVTMISICYKHEYNYYLIQATQQWMCTKVQKFERRNYICTFSFEIQTLTVWKSFIQTNLPHLRSNLSN